jgi:hypothetical protein
MTDPRTFGEDVLNRNLVWFSELLFIKPELAAEHGIEIDYSNAAHHGRQLLGLQCGPECMVGVVLKARGRVWELTGVYDSRYGGYQGRWPD